LCVDTTCACVTGNFCRSGLGFGVSLPGICLCALADQAFAKTRPLDGNPETLAGTAALSLCSLVVVGAVPPDDRTGIRCIAPCQSILGKLFRAKTGEVSGY